MNVGEFWVVKNNNPTAIELLEYVGGDKWILVGWIGRVKENKFSCTKSRPQEYSGEKIYDRCFKVADYNEAYNILKERCLETN